MSFVASTAPENAIHFHNLLVLAIRSHDSARCRSVMRAHLTDAEKFIEQMPADTAD